MIKLKKENTIHEDISMEEFSEILKKGNIQLKQVIVGDHALLDGVQLKNTSLPKNILVGFLIRDDTVSLPDGNTYLEKNDVLILLGKEEDLNKTKVLVKGASIMNKIKHFFTGLFKIIKIFK